MFRDETYKPEPWQWRLKHLAWGIGVLGVIIGFIADESMKYGPAFLISLVVLMIFLVYKYRWLCQTFLKWIANILTIGMAGGLPIGELEAYHRGAKAYDAVQAIQQHRPLPEEVLVVVLGWYLLLLFGYIYFLWPKVIAFVKDQEEGWNTPVRRLFR